jgi:hypothetical protein
VVLTLTAEQVSQDAGFVTLVGTMISGSEVARLRIPTILMFSDVRQRMMDALKLPKNAVARFCLRGDGSVLGHSHDSRYVGAVLGLPDVADVVEMGSTSVDSAVGTRGQGTHIVPRFPKAGLFLDVSDSLWLEAVNSATLVRL